MDIYIPKDQKNYHENKIIDLFHDLQNGVAIDNGDLQGIAEAFVQSVARDAYNYGKNH
jgi:hypothetical protein